MERAQLERKLSERRPTVATMTENSSRTLRLVREDEPQRPAAPAPEPSTEDYWAQVRALRADLADLRPAN